MAALLKSSVEQPGKDRTMPSVVMALDRALRRSAARRPMR